VTGKGLRLESYETLFSIKLFPISGGVCVCARMRMLKLSAWFE
jgi:hypothetical protein